MIAIGNGGICLCGITLLLDTTDISLDVIVGIFYQCTPANYRRAAWEMSFVPAGHSTPTFPSLKNLKTWGNMTVSEQPTVHLPDQPLRHTVIILLRQTLEHEVETEHLIDWIEEMWETIDTLVQRFGEAEANKIIHARLAIHSFVGGDHQ